MYLCNDRVRVSYICNVKFLIGLLGSGASFNTFILHRLLSRDPNYKDTKESLERFLGEMARSGLVESIASGWRLV
jgi:hypothetical protein